MRAPFRNQVSPICAKWLRYGGDTGESGSTTMRHGRHGEEDVFNQNPIISPGITNVVRQGKKSGIAIVQILKTVERGQYENNITTISAFDVRQSNKKMHQSLKLKKGGLMMGWTLKMGWA